MSCLFQSLAYFTINGNAEKIRQEICDYLSTNPILFDNLTFEEIYKFEGYEEKNISQYISKMRYPSTWGGDIEIKAFCNIHSIDIDVIILGSEKVIHFYSDKKPSIGVATITWNGNHFEPFISNSN